MTNSMIKPVATRLFEDGGGTLYIVTDDDVYPNMGWPEYTYAEDMADQFWLTDVKPLTDVDGNHVSPEDFISHARSRGDWSWIASYTQKDGVTAGPDRPGRAGSAYLSGVDGGIANSQ